VDNLSWPILQAWYAEIKVEKLQTNLNLMLKVPSQIVKVETMTDGGMKVVVHTQELQPADKAELMDLHNKIGHFVFSVTGITQEDIPTEAVEFEGQKSLSERLHNVLFRLHEKQGGKPEDFPTYRARVMEKLIATYKAKLDDFEN